MLIDVRHFTVVPRMSVAVPARLIELTCLLQVFQIHLDVVDIILNVVQADRRVAPDLVRIGLMLSLGHIVLQHVRQLQANLFVMRLPLVPNQSVLASILEEIQFSLILSRVINEMLPLFGILKE